jgi:hypothetical protein
MHAPDERLPDWEAFYRDYRKPGYVAGFEITSKLGGGMFGLVFRARRMSIGKDYAIKFLHVDDESVRKAVLGELEQVKYFAQIDHPNLVSIEDRGEVDGIPYLVMAFAGTETLRDKMPGGRVPTAVEKDELLRYFLQCCRGLAALHERSLVHFDIKPANVFLKGGVARLGDYGLSKLVTHSRGSLSMGRGTPYYMAPEMLQRRGDHRSDVYSLGVMLYELLCGTVPFTGDSEWEVLKKHETQPPELPAHLAPRERAVLQRCLAKDPAARYQSVHDLIATFALEAAPRAASTAGLQNVHMPDCVPPAIAAAALVHSLPPPLPADRRPARLGLALVLMLGALGASIWVGRTQSAVAMRRTVALPRLASAPAPTRAIEIDDDERRSATPSAMINGKVDQLVASIQRTVRTATQKQKRTELADIDTDAYALPRDFRVYRDRVKELSKQRTWSAGQALTVERLGRPAFVAAVMRLHELDYGDADNCRYAANVHRLLAQMTAISGLECQATGAEGSEVDLCRFLAIADGWRRIAEQFGKVDASFQQLLVAKGKTGASR